MDTAKLVFNKDIMKEPYPDNTEDDKEVGSDLRKEGSFIPGDILEHKTGQGPKLLYLGEGRAEFWNPQGMLCNMEVDDISFCLWN